MADAPAPAPAPKRPGVTLMVLATVVIVGLLLMLPKIMYTMAHEDTDDAFIDADVIQVAPKVAGQVLKVYVADNQQVKKGDLLVELDPADYQVAYNSAVAALRQAQERHKANRITVGLTQVTTGAVQQEANATVTQAEQAAEAAEASISVFRSQVQTAQNGVSQARARVSQANDQVKTAQREVDVQQASVGAARADARRAEADYRRYVNLFHQDAVSRQLLDQAAAAAWSAESNLSAARARVLAAENRVAEMRSNAESAADALRQAQSAAQEAEVRVQQAEAQAASVRSTIGQAQGKLAQANTAPEQIEVSRQQVRTAEADIDAARAQVEQARLRLSYCRIVAPADGRVTNKSVQAGQVMQVGQDMLALVSNNVWVTANFKETQLQHMKPGDKVDIKVDAYPNRTFKGHIDSIQAGSGAAFSLLPPENATGNYVKIVQRVPVKIVFDEVPDGIVLGPGMSVVPYVSAQ